ncbi:MAG TPA: PQQ-binding-like beta-propeller repeat protein, partial [Gammaproteobacteria bacterium]
MTTAFPGRFPFPLLALWLVVAAGCGDNDAATQGASTEPARRVSGAQAERLRHPDREPHNWLTHGRDWAEQRFTPLDQINDGNAARLGLAWYLDLGTTWGVQATPLVVDGVMYLSSVWNVIHAVDAATGRELWRHDPKTRRDWLRRACCGPTNRGLAFWNGKLYEGTLDGRLIAIEAPTGNLAWEVLTIDPAQDYSISGAPRVVNGKVIIGNGGAEYGVRGYVTAYDAETGRQLWRFYTVPGNPEDGFENAAMEMAAKTWSGEWWKFGGGGTAWDSFAFDPELNLLYIGTGNGGPWPHALRSPGGGDNLFLSSIVAVNADTGEYVWHFQTTPAENWDYTATQSLILADLDIGGAARKVIMQLPKNGFYYVLDRATGEFLSAKNVVPVNWTRGLDPETGRPRIAEENLYDGAAKLV